MTKEEVVADLRAYVARCHKTQHVAAAHWGVSVAWVNMVMNGHRDPTEKMLADVGIERVTPPIYYRRIKKVKS